MVLSARATDRQQRGQVYVPMHWGGEVLGGGGINGLTSPARCPGSKQPELKHAAVALEPVDLPWRLTAMAWLDGADALALRERLRPALERFGYACLLPFEIGRAHV